MTIRSAPRLSRVSAISATATLIAIALLLWPRSAPGGGQQSAGKVTEELVHVRAEDGIVNGGVVFTAPKASAKPIAVIWIHGWGANFYHPSYVKIGKASAERGYTTITANTRMHDI